MTYKIIQREGLTIRTVAKNFHTVDCARAFLARWGELIAFEPDLDGHDAADAALVRKGGALEIYAVERED